MHCRELQVTMSFAHLLDGCHGQPAPPPCEVVFVLEPTFKQNESQHFAGRWTAEESCQQTGRHGKRNFEQTEGQHTSWMHAQLWKKSFFEDTNAVRIMVPMVSTRPTVQALLSSHPAQTKLSTPQERP